MSKEKNYSELCSNRWISWENVSAKYFLQLLDCQWPKPHCELDFTNDFDCLVALILSAQSTDKIVNQVTKSLFKNSHEPFEILRLSMAKLQSIIRPVGLHLKKSNYISSLARFFCVQSLDLESINALLELPGVGRKIAQVFLCLRRNVPSYPVDTHIFRICKRTEFAVGSSPKSVEDAIKQRVKKSEANRFHFQMVLHGRYVCKSRTPVCQKCLLRRHCRFFKENIE